MDHVEMNNIDENKIDINRKRSSFLRNGSYQSLKKTKKSIKNTDDDHLYTNNLNETIKKKEDSINNKFSKKSLTLTNGNGLKEFLFPQKKSCELTSTETKTPQLVYQSTNNFSPSINCLDTTSIDLLKKDKQHVDREDIVDDTETDRINETKVHVIPAEKLKKSSKEKKLIRTHPEIRASFRRRRQRFMVACGTVLVALTIIITIIVYAIIMTIKHKTHMNQLLFRNHPR